MRGSRHQSSARSGICYKVAGWWPGLRCKWRNGVFAGGRCEPRAKAKTWRITTKEALKPVTNVYFDESGNTGTELLDPHQPYFTTGSTDVPEAEAADIIKRCFPKHKGTELKSKELLKRPQGQKGYLAFAGEVARRPNSFVATKIHKRFSVLAKMVDHLSEPVMYAAGYDFYKNDYAVRYANMAFNAFETFLKIEDSTALFAAFNAFARAPDAALLGVLRTTLREVGSRSPEHAGMFIGMMEDGADRIDDNELASLQDTNDIHVTSLLTSMGHWQSHYPGPFAVLHDESMHFFSRTERWSEMTDPKQPPQVISVGAKTLTLPISVVSTTETHSHESSSLQLCDLVAGFVSRASTSTNAAFQAFVQDAIEAGMGELSVYPVAPGTDFVDGLPAVADGLDAVDLIRTGIAAVRAQKT